MNINITPALQIDEKKNLSAEEFQKQLCGWLESKGMLSELRAYFRSNMIEVLKNTALGSSISCRTKQTISPKMQAMNLLISEYFIYSQYHFSLCVFCTEVSLNNIFPNITNTMAEVTNRKSTFKFAEKEVYDILESLGILRHNMQAQKIYALYCDSDEPLISYFLPSTSMTSIVSNETIDVIEYNEDADYDTILGSIDKILLNSNMSPQEVSVLKFYVKNIFEKQKEKQTKAIENLKDQYKIHLKRYKIKLIDIQKSFEIERRKFQEEIDLMKQELDDVLVQNQLAKRSRGTFQDIKVTNLTEQVQQTELRTDHKSTQSEEKKGKNHKSDEEQQTFTNVSLESAVLKHVVQQLEKENSTLRIDNVNYCEQIDELANRASILMNELNISQQHVIKLNNLLQNVPSTFVGNIPQIQHTLHYTGAGEEYSGSVRNAIPKSYLNLNKGRKLSTKKQTIQSSSSGSSSPTDDLLQEAKKKLKNLELESEDIDRKIRAFTDKNSFAAMLNENKCMLDVNKHFKFSGSNNLSREKVYTFGTSLSTPRDSNANAAGRVDSQTSLATTSTAYSHVEPLQAGEEEED